MLENLSIIQLTDSASRRNGGITESLLGLTGALGALPGLHLQVLACHDPDFARDHDRFHPIPTEAFPLRGCGPLTLSPALQHALSSLRPHLIHLHGIWGPAGRALAQAHLPPSTRILISPHGMMEDWAMNRSRLKKRLSHLVWEGRLFRSASSFHALSDSEALTMKKWTGDTPISVIPNGTALPPVPPPPTPDGPLLFLGRIHPMKGLDLLLHAWARCRHLPPLAGRALTLAGWDENGHQDHLLTLARQLGLRLPEEVHFPGPAYGEEKERLLASASALILPSHNEGLPMMILEAWARARPVLMTDACHLPLGFQTGAALRISTSPDSIAAQLQAFFSLTPTDRLRMGQNGRLLVEQHFRWPAIALRFAQLYRNLTHSPPPNTQS